MIPTLRDASKSEITQCVQLASSSSRISQLDGAAVWGSTAITEWHLAS